MNMMSTLSVIKIESIMRTQLVHPDTIVELLEQLYQKNMQRFIDKQSLKFNFMRFGFDTTETIRKQYYSIFPTWRELNNNFDSQFCYLANHEISEFKFLFKVLKCLNCMQRIMRLHLFTTNPVQIDYESYSQVRFFWKNEESIRNIIYGD
jgi:hypothetical protein